MVWIALSIAAGHGVPFGSAISGEFVILPGVFGFQRACTPDGIKLLPDGAEKVLYIPLITTSQKWHFSGYTF